MRWLIELKGEAFDIEEFPRWFPDGDIYATREGGSFYITGSGLQALGNASAIREAAIQLIDEYFSIASLLVPSLVKPTCGAIIEEAQGNRRIHHVLVAETLHVRAKTTAVLVTAHGNTDDLARPTQAQRLLHGSKKNKHLKVATMLCGESLRSWPRLYRILEEVEAFTGKVQDPDRERFRRSANSAEVAGKDSRHRGGKFEPPKKPMSLEEADNFIRRILSRALSSNVDTGT